MLLIHFPAPVHREGMMEYTSELLPSEAGTRQYDQLCI
jgi:hypothetical protein